MDIKTDGISLDFCEQNKFLEDVASAKMFIYLETRQVFLTWTADKGTLKVFTSYLEINYMHIS